MLLRLKFLSKEGDLLYTLACTQFPIWLCFAITINKSQGQSFKTVGIDLCYLIFSYSQFYITVSYTTSIANLHILPTYLDKIETLNESYPRVLSNINS